MFHIARGLKLPLEFVTSTQAILAIKGAGKSYCASVQAEQLLKHNQQVVVIDPTGAWWGLRSSASGKGNGFPIAVFGGDHGDVPLGRDSGEVIAAAIVAEGFSAVLDLSHFRKGELRRFMADFLETLFRKNREAMHLFIDEADLFAPQQANGEVARVLGAMEDIVRRGRIRGVGCTMITQRPAVLNKNVMTQADMLTCLRMSHQLDLKAIGDWVAVHADVSQWKTMQAALPNLPTGTGWFWNPSAELFVQAKINTRTTFDSGATPKAGQRKIEPRKLATVDVKKLGEAIAATIERAKENAPETMRARIHELEAEVEQLQADSEAEPERVEVPVGIPLMTEKHLEELRYLQGAFEDLRDDATEKCGRLEKFMLSVEENMAVATAESNRLALAAHALPKHTVKPAPQPRSTKRMAGKARMLNALSAGGGDLPRDVLAIWSMMSPSSGTFTKYLSELKKADKIRVNGAGLFVLTTIGRADSPEVGVMREHLQAEWAARFGSGGKRRIFDVLLKMPSGLSRDVLAHCAELQSSSGTYTKYLSEVRRTGILIGTSDNLRLHPALWLDQE